jgi:hypothetical protein
MFFLLLRILGALVAAAVAAFGVFVLGALSSGDQSSGAWVAWTSLGMLVASSVAFVWMFRRLGRGKLAQWRVESQIASRRAQAVRRDISPRARLVALVLGGGSHATATLRAAWDDSRNLVSVDAAEEGAWRTVFTARFHPEVAGQVVPGEIRPHLIHKDRSSISTRRVAHESAWWEVLAYLPGDWEEELNRLWEAAKEARTEQEKDRFGL